MKPKTPQPTTCQDWTYLEMAKKLSVVPNFYMSEAYFDYARLIEHSDKDRVWVEGNGWCVFPPLPYPIDFDENIWCDMGGLCPPDWYQKKELDWEYIFDPWDFNDMTGGKWNTFRKNVRKWPRGNPNHAYLSELLDNLSAEHLMGEWLEERMESAQDADIMIKMALDHHPNVRHMYLYRGRELVGINVFDWNYRYINYRLCIVKPGERFLDEYLRFLFYTNSDILLSGMLVNDGGTLGREGLERFKDKMNPKIKRKRYSWIKKEL